MFRAFHFDKNQNIFNKYCSKINNENHFEFISDIEGKTYSFDDILSFSIISEDWKLSFGLKYYDTSKKELFTGDIVIIDKELYYIDLDYHNIVLAYAIVNNKISKEYTFNLNFLLETDASKQSLKILGNVYQNPEFLKFNPKQKKKKGVKNVCKNKK